MDELKPGMNTNLSFGNFEVENERIVRLFSRVWYITFVRRQLFKNTNYEFAFGKPTELLKRDFHLEREVLIIFNDARYFEAKALDFVDKTINDYQNRLDKLCVILVSKDTKVETAIRQMAMQDKESRIVIPFSYNDFSQSNNVESVIIRRFKEFLYERDLFAFDSPLRTDNYFYGRKTIVQELYGKYKSNQNGSLFGLRRIGKTSVLLSVKRFMSLRDEPAVFIDCSETAFHRRRWYEALFFIVYTLVQELKLEGKISIESEEKYTEKNASIVFESELKKIQTLLGGQKILLMFDEIESITFDISPSEHWATGMDYLYFWQSIRPIYQKNPNLFSFIISGVNPKAVETSLIGNHDNPIYRFTTPNYLDFFDFSEVKEMVSSIGNYMGLKFDDQVFTYLTDDYGGHPFLIRQICSQLHRFARKSRPYTITRFFYLQHRNSLNKSIEDYIALIIEILEDRYPDEYELLQVLAQGDLETFSEFAQMSNLLISHLEGYGLIQEDGRNYHFRINGVKEYIQRNSSKPKILHTKEEKWSEISKKRNILETNLRKLVRTSLKAHHSPEEARDTFLSIIPGERKKKLSQLDFTEIFTSEIYFDDLRKIIIKQWNELGIIFGNDRERFSTHMEYVNKHRIDAHANDIDDESMSLTLISIEWLEKRVDE